MGVMEVERIVTWICPKNWSVDVVCLPFLRYFITSFIFFLFFSYCFCLVWFLFWFFICLLFLLHDTFDICDRTYQNGSDFLAHTFVHNFHFVSVSINVILTVKKKSVTFLLASTILFPFFIMHCIDILKTFFHYKPHQQQQHNHHHSQTLLFTPLEFFTSVLADCFSLEFEWQQVSSSLQDFPQDSGRSQ